MKLNINQTRDLFNALDILRQCYADQETIDAIVAKYAPGTPGFDRTFELYRVLGDLTDNA